MNMFIERKTSPTTVPVADQNRHANAGFCLPMVFFARSRGLGVLIPSRRGGPRLLVQFTPMKFTGDVNLHLGMRGNVRP